MASADTPAHQHFPKPQVLIIPFQVPNRSPCTAQITIEPGTDPVRDGEDLIAIYDDPQVTLGFPLLHGTVSSPVSRTYASIYGWVQITWTPGEDWVMDLYPVFQDINSPFAFWGAEPTIVDAPSRDIRDPKWKDYDWIARTFLTYDPKAAMEKTVVPILAMEWGFWIKDGKPYVKELKRLDLETWNKHLDLFRNKFKDWTFKEVIHPYSSNNHNPIHV